MQSSKNIAVLTGAGISAESGIKTFRDADGLWEGHDIMEVASPQGYRNNPALVLNFYNQRRRQLHTVKPNAAHMALARLQAHCSTHIITQNVDNLHEAAGSIDVIHLHGELLKVRSTRDPNYIIDWPGDLSEGDMAPDGAPLRPHIVWFGEDVPLIQTAAEIVAQAEILIIVGTSMQVYPAAGLAGLASPETPIYYIDPRPQISYELSQAQNLNIIAEKASEGLPPLVDQLIQG